MPDSRTDRTTAWGDLKSIEKPHHRPLPSSREEHQLRFAQQFAKTGVAISVRDLRFERIAKHFARTGVVITVPEPSGWREIPLAGWSLVFHSASPGEKRLRSKHNHLRAVNDTTDVTRSTDLRESQAGGATPASELRNARLFSGPHKSISPPAS